MKITDQDIIHAIRQLRDEDNEQLHVRSMFNRTSPRHHTPAWFIAIPAAAAVGFFIGIWTQTRSQTSAPLTTLVDTVYIKVPAPQPPQDSAVLVAAAIPAPSPRRAVRTNTTPHPNPASLGRSMEEDHIRYDLLVIN